VSCDWLMVDGSSLIFRSYYGARRRSGVAGEEHVNAVAPFLDRLAAVIEQRGPSHLVVAEDRAWRPAWRVELIASYKSHRVADPAPPDLAPQLPVIGEILAAAGIDVVGVEDHEAEDVIATLTGLASGTVEILSGDRDLFALVEGARVRILYPEKGGYAIIDEQEVTRRYEIPGDRYGDFAILRGDPSDGLPGLKGVGAVGAAAMIRRYGNVEGLLRDRELRDTDRDYLERAMRVVPPVADLPIGLPLGRRSRYPADERALNVLVERHTAKEASDRLLTALVALDGPE
jgi:5'-3' exonuclease